MSDQTLADPVAQAHALVMSCPISVLLVLTFAAGWALGWMASALMIW